MSKKIEREWFEHDPFKTNFFNSISITLPIIEHFIVTSINHFYNEIDNEKIKIEMKLLTKEELAHTEIHKLYNKIIEREGFSISFPEKVMEKMLNIFSMFGPKNKLAFTLALEHIIGTPSKIIIERELLKNVHPKMRKLWEWHALEEIEHRGVAFDVYRYLKLSNTRRYICCIIITITLGITTFFTHIYLLIIDKSFFKLRVWKNGLKFLYSKNGFFTLIIPHWIKFFTKDFHPNNLEVKDYRNLMKNKKDTETMKKELIKYFV